MGKLSRTMLAAIAVIFGIFWIVTAASIGAPAIFTVFGLIFIGMVAFVALKMLLSR